MKFSLTPVKERDGKRPHVKRTSPVQIPSPNHLTSRHSLLFKLHSSFSVSAHPYSSSSILLLVSLLPILAATPPLSTLAHCQTQ